MPRNPEASIEIDAPLALVWSVMLDTASYAAWNPFVVRADCPSPPKPGDPIVLHVRWANGKGTRSPERIAIVAEPSTHEDGSTSATLAYDYEGFPSKIGLIRGRRYQRLTQEPGGPTRYDTVEEFSGPLVGLAGPGRVTEGFRRHAGALKERAESMVTDG